jgi:hypothetical protein
MHFSKFSQYKFDRLLSLNTVAGVIHLDQAFMVAQTGYYYLFTNLVDGTTLGKQTSQQSNRFQFNNIQILNLKIRIIY